MALFGSKKKSEEAGLKTAPKMATKQAAKTAAEKKAAPKTAKTAPQKVEKAMAPKKVSEGTHESHGNHEFILTRPRITEKASLKAESESVFVFEVARNANKEMIYRAIVDLYKVTPRKIAIAQTPSKNVFSRGKKGVHSGVKKAYVYLNKGEKIEIM